jgi:hypothetical protein
MLAFIRRCSVGGCNGVLLVVVAVAMFMFWSGGEVNLSLVWVHDGDDGNSLLCW